MAFPDDVVGVPGATGMLCASQLGRGSGNLNQESQCCLQVGDMVTRIYELDNAPPTQGHDSVQHFCGEHLGMIDDKVCLDFTRTSPHEIAEWASAPGQVFVLHVSFKLLGPSEVFVAISTDWPHLLAHGATSLVRCDALGRQMSSSSVGLRLGYDVSVHSSDSRFGGACLVGREIVLWSHLIQRKP